MFMRASFQTGSLTKTSRKRGPDVWHFRWREQDTGGKIVRRKIAVGTVEQYPTKTTAKKALAALAININQQRATMQHPALMTMADLAAHYDETELGEKRQSKTQGTVDVYREFIKYWIAPRWNAVRLSAVKPVEVEQWLRSLKLANGTKAKIRNIMSALFQHALRHQFLTVNPIRGLVRQSALRQRDPDVLTAAEIRSILKRLSFVHQTMVFLAASTGLRVSEIRGLQWQDLDPSKGVLALKRGVVKNNVTDLKTKASRRPVPIHPALVDALQFVRRSSPYDKPTDWIFASPHSKGKVPLWSCGVMQKHIQPAVKEAGIHKNVGWHTFRHSYATLLKGNGEDVKTVQESLRHATFQVTMDVYTQAIPESLRSAQAKVVGQISDGGPAEEAAVCLVDPYWTVEESGEAVSY
jgi:integrase